MDHRGVSQDTQNRLHVCLLESFEALTPLLAMCYPIACELLRIRTRARQTGSPASQKLRKSLKLYEMLRELGFDYVIRFRDAIIVQDSSGKSFAAWEWVPTNGRARMLRDVFVTLDHCPVPAVVWVKDKDMKDNWCLATSRADLQPKQIVVLYGKRFTIEENFRDTKDPRYGLGLSATHLSELPFR